MPNKWIFVPLTYIEIPALLKNGVNPGNGVWGLHFRKTKKMMRVSVIS